MFASCDDHYMYLYIKAKTITTRQNIKYYIEYFVRALGVELFLYFGIKLLRHNVIKDLQANNIMY